MSRSRLLIEDYGGVTLVTFIDSTLLECSTVEQVGKDLYHLTDHLNKQKLVLDFSNVRLLSSHTLGILLTLYKKAKEIKGKVVLCGLRPDLMKIFTITNLVKIFEFYPTDAEALKAFGVPVS